MRLSRSVKPLLFVVAATVLAASGYFTRDAWLPWAWNAKPVEAVESTGDAARPASKIIVGDQAQQNLGLTASQLRAETVWKAITVPGMVVDRPGLSDRGVVAPVTAVVSAIHHVPGDTVRAGDVLFTLTLLSESLHTTQTDLFKTAEEIKLTQAQRKRLVGAGAAIPESRVIDVDGQIKRLEVAAKAYRQQLLNRGLSPDDVARVATGAFVSQIPVVAPERASGQRPLTVARVSNPASAPALVFELQELKVELGQQVQAGQTLCLLANHQLLSIEGRAFRDETTLLERSVGEGWPVEVDFHEDAKASWPVVERTFLIHHVANSIDPINRTFAFLLPLENQSKAVKKDGRTQLLWRFRPGQKVRLRVRVEEVKNVFVLPPDAVARDGPEAFVFTQNVNTFERKGVRVLFQDRDRVVIANDGSLPTYPKGKEVWTIPAVAQAAAAQLSRMAKAGSSGAPKGYHIHADGSLHKNEDEGK